ncbi:MAG TPA: ubiquinol-cytochrome C chaperone family protein [Rhizomicrobium sp.]|jgi:cytochrome b pre-mRNA-processing protein 3|nr:ubiquinol-cytochrome C chaperone family protein [Rhizomicrobium sp.]
MLNVFANSRPERGRAAELFDALVRQSRLPEFYTALGVADTIDGRFDLLTLHAWLVLEWLKANGEGETAQALINRIFVSFDESLRDLGVGDIGIGHRVKKMADAFYGRLDAYSTVADEDALAAAIMRNIYRGDGQVSAAAHALAHYANTARTNMRLQSDAPDFGPLPGA